MWLVRLLSVFGLGMGGVLGVAAPAQAASGPWVQVSAGNSHTCAINANGSLYCWGFNDVGQTGDGTQDNPRLSLVRVGASGVWSSVSAGDHHTCGITKAANLYCWGNNEFGQTGDGTQDNPRTSLYRVGAAGVWSTVNAGVNHTCGITKAANLYCWGLNTSGQIGDGTINTPRLSLYRVGAPGVWSAVNIGANHTCGITKAANLYCWGLNTSGQIGDGTQNNPRLSLYRVGAAGVWSSVNAGREHTCGITKAANLYCWGINAFGQVGDGTQNNPRLSLYRVGAAGVWSSVSAGGFHTCAITKAANLYCWGLNVFGQVGDGTIDNPRLSLYRVGSTGGWSSVSAGVGHTCGITPGKDLFCWGNNAWGQVGDGTQNNPRPNPFRVD